MGVPAEFRFLTSTIRKSDPPGSVIEDWGDELEELGPLEVTLDADPAVASAVSTRPEVEEALVPVTLESRVTETGTLELWCHAKDSAQQWKLELNIREGAHA